MSGDSSSNGSGVEHRVYGTRENASFQVIILGCNGGPREDTVTGLLVRAPQAEWRKNSLIAIDAGVHLASIISILQTYMPRRSDKVAEPGYFRILEKGPFAGIKFPYYSAKANALYVFRELLHSFLITHPHLDHLSALGINTPALEYGREAKAIVALPPTIEAIKNHIFNDSIWPNLSDENHGVGFVTYRRLTEGGNLRFGSGEARGYVSVCDGLATKCLAVTHGKCQRRNRSFSHQRGESAGWMPSDYNFPLRRMSRVSDDHASYFAAMSQQQGYSAGMWPPGGMPTGQMTPGPAGGTGSVAGENNHHNEPVTSSAFFIRNEATGKEILVFGDIEPDSVSMAPRNCIVWDEAAPKISNGVLKAIFIECSYDDSVRDSDLFGHLCPRHLTAELHNLAKKVMMYREKQAESSQRSTMLTPATSGIHLHEPPSRAELSQKRKREVNGDGAAEDISPRVRPVDHLPPSAPSQYVGGRRSSISTRRTSREAGSPLQRPNTPSRIPRHVQFQTSPQRPRALSPTVPESEELLDPPGTLQPPALPSLDTMPSQPSDYGANAREALPQPLKGLAIHIIHVKDTMVDGRSPGETIAEELKAHATNLNLGCDFDVTDCAESIWI